MNLGDEKNTIEFRLPNGTLDEDTWIQNIDLFGGLVKACENLAMIQTKAKQERTEKDQRMLEHFEQLKNSEISQEQKLEELLSIVIPEEQKEIYRERYRVNSVLIEQNPTIKEKITSQVAKIPINVKQIGKKVFLGADCVTGEEYNKESEIIKNNLKENNLDRI